MVGDRGREGRRRWWETGRGKGGGGGGGQGEGREEAVGDRGGGKGGGGGGQGEGREGVVGDRGREGRRWWEGREYRKLGTNTSCLST